MWKSFHWDYIETQISVASKKNFDQRYELKIFHTVWGKVILENSFYSLFTTFILLDLCFVIDQETLFIRVKHRSDEHLLWLYRVGNYARYMYHEGEWGGKEGFTNWITTFFGCWVIRKIRRSFSHSPIKGIFDIIAPNACL